MELGVLEYLACTWCAPEQKHSCCLFFVKDNCMSVLNNGLVSHHCLQQSCCGQKVVICQKGASQRHTSERLNTK